ncbi:hypothetical protein [Colwellia sp. 12G3]|uniref:hypothetical protein n=1 Tax=Colwellia sp. 12G3 TaxID=2058299 RepID=UPI000C32F5C7|nr:hypothetical protein [Colwellia sp. 12G3]PKI12715.1 hypothetical protein CXF71_18445 [Colwellia sp. 12G3]
MTYFIRYEKALSDYRQWINDLTDQLNNVENTILQKDKSDLVVEKLVSITIASVFVSIGSAILALIGLAAVGLIGGILLFIVGWLLSRGVNKKAFGSERTMEGLSEQERRLLSEKELLIEKFRPIAKKINIESLRKDVAFTRYNDLHNMLLAFSQLLMANKSDDLAYKYRYRYQQSIQRNRKLIQTFNCIYAPQHPFKK